MRATLWFRSVFWNLALTASARRALATMAAPSPRDGDDGGCDAVSESPGDSKLDASFEMDDEHDAASFELDESPHEDEIEIGSTHEDENEDELYGV